MEHQTITLDGRDYVIVPRDEFEKLAGRTAAGIELPPLPEADAKGNRPAIAYARASIARSIITRMNEVGVTQADLARESGVPAATLNRILKTVRTPDESTVAKIDKALTKLDASKAVRRMKSLQGMVPSSSSEKGVSETAPNRAQLKPQPARATRHVNT